MTNSQNITIILGVPGSGLNLLSQCLQILGLTSLNHPEHPDTLTINTMLLKDLGFSPLMTGPLPAGWLCSDAATKANKRIEKILVSCESSNQPFFLVAPLLCRVLPVWLKAFQENNIEHKCIHIIRHPWEITQSMATHEKIDLAKALLIWFIQVRDILRHCPDHFLITFDQLLADPITTLHAGLVKLNVSDESLITHYSALLSFVQSKLKNHHVADLPDQDKQLFKPFERLYQKLQLGQSFEAEVPCATADFRKNCLLHEIDEESLKRIIPSRREAALPSETDFMDFLLQVIGQFETREHRQCNPEDCLSITSKTGQALRARIFFPDSYQTVQSISSVQQGMDFRLPSDMWFEIKIPVPRPEALQVKPIRFQPLSTNGLIAIAAIKLIKPGTGRVAWGMSNAKEFDACKIYGSAFRLPSEDGLLLMITGHEPWIELPVLVDIVDCPLEMVIWVKAGTDQGCVSRYFDVKEMKITENAIADLPQREFYNKAFYDAQKSGSELSAKAVLSLLFKHYMPHSIIDIGCGVGTWIKIALELGVKHGFGVDGEYAEKELIIPRTNFMSADLNFSLPELGRFDLAMTLEVAEHLNPERADGFIEDICKLSDVILFSAAIPYQGGACHLNEKWPEYWAQKFTDNGFVAIDFLRSDLWNNLDVEWWYRQNILLFALPEKAVEIFGEKSVANPKKLSRVHPELFIKRVHKRLNMSSSNLEEDLNIYQRNSQIFNKMSD